MSDAQPALAVRRLSKTFPGQRALGEVSLEVAPGEIRALVGQNGSGKSTLVKVLAGYHDADPGSEIEVAGTARFVHQDLDLITSLSAADNFSLDDRGLGTLSCVRPDEERRRAATALAELGWDGVDVTVPVGELSESQQRAVSLARALRDADGLALLVLDEITASMPWVEATKLFDTVRRIAASGVAVVFISHHLDEVTEVADSTSILRDGELIGTFANSDLTHEQMVGHMLGSAPEDWAHRPRSAPENSDVVLEVTGLCGRVLRNLDLEVRRGEIVGVAGLTGSGRDEVAGLLSGRHDRRGEVAVAGVPVRRGSPSSAVRAGLRLVPGDRAAAALLRDASVRENVVISDSRRHFKGGRLRRRSEADEVGRWITELGIVTNGCEQPIGRLSGGNQQKAILARSFRVDPKVLVVDEPTQGVDVGAQGAIHDTMVAAAANGMAIVVCSSDSEELARVCHRVLVLRRGRVVDVLEGRRLRPEVIDEVQLQLDPQLHGAT